MRLAKNVLVLWLIIGLTGPVAFADSDKWSGDDLEMMERQPDNEKSMDEAPTKVEKKIKKKKNRKKVANKKKNKKKFAKKKKRKNRSKKKDI